MKYASGLRFLRIAAVLVMLWLCYIGWIFWLMHQPPDRFGAVVAKLPIPALMLIPFETLWNQARAGSVDVGELAPDFQLPTLDKKAVVTLASLRGSKPVVLVFGSYT